MPLSWNEIKDRALAFSKEWVDESSENAEAKSFWDAFFEVFGITRRRIASFEVPVKKADDRGGFIDLLWKGVLLVEHKSRGKDLDRAYGQALDYFPGLKERDLPRYVLVSDFAHFRLFDLDLDETYEFPLEDLHKNVSLFGFIAGYQTRSFGQEDPVNIRAAEQLGRLHDQLEGAWDLLCKGYIHAMRQVWGWPPRKYAKTIEDHGVDLDSVAVANLAQCSIPRDKYTKGMLDKCAEKHTYGLIEILKPRLIVAQGKTSCHLFKDNPGIKAPVVEGVHQASRQSKEDKCALFSGVMGCILERLKY